jgi:hypothetical protein
MVKAFTFTKILYRAKHVLRAFTTVKTTNVISTIITLVSPPQ